RAETGEREEDAVDLDHRGEEDDGRGRGAGAGDTERRTWLRGESSAVHAPDPESAAERGRRPRGHKRADAEGPQQSVHAAQDRKVERMSAVLPKPAALHGRDKAVAIRAVERGLGQRQVAGQRPEQDDGIGGRQPERRWTLGVMILRHGRPRSRGWVAKGYW